jgi:hypothetical protein
MKWTIFPCGQLIFLMNPSQFLAGIRLLVTAGKVMGKTYTFNNNIKTSWG